MPYYSDDFKEYVKQTAKVEEVIQAITGTVQQRGQHYVAICPFHEDTHPSLMINVMTQTWSCNACGAGSRHHHIANSSDVFGFVKGYFGYNFGQAIEYIASMYGIALPSVDPQQQKEFEKHQWWINKTNAAQMRFVKNLMDPKNRDAYLYLRNRGITDTMIDLFGLGVGDDVDIEFKNTKNKISFPIYNTRNEIISFTGRVPFGQDILDELNEKRKLEHGENVREVPKYDHRWPLTNKYNEVPKEYIENHPYPTFDKRKYLFGIQLAASYIQQWKRAVVVEGFTDVTRLHQHGICNSVGTLGTSLTKEQCQLLQRLGAKSVLLMRDGDLAGIQGMERDSKMLQEFGITVEVMPLPPGEDPDSLGLQFSYIKDEYARYIEGNTKLLSEWRVERVFREKENELIHHYDEIYTIREERVKGVVEALSEEPDPIKRDLLTHQYAELLNVSVESLQSKIQYTN